MDILYSDGGMNKHTGDEAWGSVVNREGKDMVGIYAHLFSDMKLKTVDLPVGRRMIAISKFSDVKFQQNNGAELLAFLMALRIAQHCKMVREICSDSQLLIQWWSKGVIAKQICPEKRNFIQQTVVLRSEFERNGGHITKISGDSNPADLGFH